MKSRKVIEAALVYRCRRGAMLSFQLFLLLLAISSSTSQKTSTLNKAPAGDCARLNCPPVEEPVCARLVRRPGNQTVYVVMVNKCEMNYIKCHKGLEGAVVPMKNCDHGSILKTKGSKRSKREAETENNETEELPAEIVMPQGSEPSYEPEDVPGVHDIPENSGEEFAPDNMPPPDLGDQNAERYSEIDEWNGDSVPPEEGNEDDEGGEVQDEEEEDQDEEDQDDGGDDVFESGAIKGPPVFFPPKEGQGIDDSQFDEEFPEDEERWDKGSDLGDEDFQQEQDKNWPPFDPYEGKENLQAGYPNLPMEQDKVALYDDNVDKRQYHAECPSVCPLRDVMVCARCQHGVYRTFLTVCHLRMFVCQHKDEMLSLISREACALSAPFLSDPGSFPRGRVREPNDDDRVLRYLRCNQLSQGSREADPRCHWLVDQFKGKQQLMMHIPDYY